MTEIRFYHMRQKQLDQALPEILTKALAGGYRIVIRAGDETQAERLNDLLWTYRPDSFLPHGMQKDGYAEDQPVWITSQDENPNGADVLILTSGSTTINKGDFKLCCEMFDGRDAEMVKSARERWKLYQEQGFDITYWQQNDKGGWEKK